MKRQKIVGAKSISSTLWFPLMNNNSVGKCFNGFGGSIDRENDAQKQQQLKRSTWIPIRSQIIDVPPECSPV